MSQKTTTIHLLFVSLYRIVFFMFTMADLVHGLSQSVMINREFFIQILPTKNPFLNRKNVEAVNSLY